LHLEEHLAGLPTQGFIDLLHELGPVSFDFIKDLVNVFFYSEKISLDAFLFEESYRGNLPLLRQLVARNHCFQELSHITLEMLE